MIGSGAYGSVVKAYDLYLEDYVAIKKVQNVDNNNIMCKRILREVSLLR